ncbi:MAG: NAD-dependent malic enzyme [Deltaproteobacteria bacterium]|jgi:malate dehydrogenase (oxaloacetate-decarboxylating)|nr:NAD-dependent malic enzyme [Deltaproteobacteria bacterium]
MIARVSKVLYDGEIDLSYVKSTASLCRLLADDPSELPNLTGRWNKVAIISDGSGVPGIGDIGPLPTLPYVEKKSVIYKKLAGIDAFPLVLNPQSLDEMVKTIQALAPSFGAINLEAINESRCLSIRNRLMEEGGLPVFQDNPDGIPIVCLAALLNSLKLVGKKLGEVGIVLSGTEAEAMPMVDFLSANGAADIIVCDRSGTIHKGRAGPTNWVKENLAKKTNPRQVKGSPAKALAGADVFISLSGPPVLNKELLSSMAPDPICFYLTDCTPDLFSRPSLDTGTPIIATTCPVLPNHLTGCLVFPGIIRGALDARASLINLPMKIAASEALASMVPDELLDHEMVLPQVLTPGLVPHMASRVAKAAEASGVSDAVNE